MSLERDIARAARELRDERRIKRQEWRQVRRFVRERERRLALSYNGYTQRVKRALKPGKLAGETDIVGSGLMGWVPPVSDDDVARLTAIEPGIPDYMRSQVAGWAVEVLGGRHAINENMISVMSLNLKEELPSYFEHLQLYLVDAPDDFLVSVLDWLLYHLQEAKAAHGYLKFILDSGRSEWTVHEIEEDRPRMARRVPEGVEAVIAQTVERTGSAGRLLARAFNSIHGAAPNPNHAYDMCVKSVETIACPLFLPSSPRATLGSVSSHLSQKNVVLPLREAGAPDKELIVSMMRKLFLGAERHGSENYADVSLDGAKTALSLATALLSMLHEDVIAVS